MSAAKELILEHQTYEVDLRDYTGYFICLCGEREPQRYGEMGDVKEWHAEHLAGLIDGLINEARRW